MKSEQRHTSVVPLDAGLDSKCQQGALLGDIREVTSVAPTDNGQNQKFLFLELGSNISFFSKI